MTATALPSQGRSPVLGWLAGVPRSLVSGRTWRRTAHLIADLPAGIVTGSVMMAMLIGSAATVFAFPIALALGAATVWVARGLGRIERYRARTLLDLPVGSPHASLRDVPWWQRPFVPLLRLSTWKEILYLLLMLPWGVVTFVGAVCAWAVSLTLVALPAFVVALPDDRANLEVMTIGAGLPAALAGVVGLVLLACTPSAIAVLGSVDAWLVRTLLGPSRKVALTARVAQLETSRTGLVDAAEAERRRIERDLHDGAQQRLVALAMDLGMAREKLATDPDQARQLLDDAHAEAKLALVELRNLARGIHPAVLTDRGLDAALSSVAARSPVPVDLRIDVATRPGATVEGTAYFIVSEALANVAKHAGATRAAVNVARRGNRLVIEVSDNGRGGADPNLGTGLAGLRDRVDGVDGWFHVSSPPGGPTTILVELPCAP